MKDTILHSAIAEISPEDFAHPGMRLVRFIFCDDQPNENGQGVKYEDFAEIKRSAIGTPIKMKFFGQSAGGHKGSIPIGYIRAIFEAEAEGAKQLIAEGQLFHEEYPEEIDYLATSFAEGNAPGISFEMKYSESVIENGIEWLKGLITRAATFVRHPAYGNRTAILALASDQNIGETQLMQELSELISDNSPKITNKGGSNRMDEKDIQALKDELKAAKEALAEAQGQLAEKDTTITDLNGQVSTLETTLEEKNTAIAEFQTKELVAERTAALVEVGVALPTEEEKLAAKQNFIVGLSAEAFAQYKDDLAEAIASAKTKTPKDASASVQGRTLQLPKFSAAAEVQDKTDVSELRGRFKDFRTTPQPE